MADLPLWVPISAAVGAATVAALSTLLGVWQKGRIDRRARIESESREQRFDLYRRLGDAMRYGDSATGSEKRALAVDIALFASDDVARAWTAYLDAAYTGTIAKRSVEQNKLVSDVLRAMRRDASRPDTKLTGIDVLACLGVREGRDEKIAEKRAREAGLL
jgi:hypothetical protein